MDNVKRQTPDIYGLFVFSALVMIALSGCGGGGGGGGARLAVTEPPASALPPRPSLSYGASYNTELNRLSALPQVKASTAYDDNIAGFYASVAVADTGVDGHHSELSRVKSGYSWHGSEKGLSDPEGHGTHVTSLVAAKRDGVGMHGLAPLAEVTAYRIFNSAGSFGSYTGGQIMPQLVNHAKARNIDVINNSWASNYEITDLSKSSVTSSLGAELNAWKNAVNDGMVMVWAAGNDGDEQVSIRAGLPYYHSQLTKGWIAVVSVDENGKEPRYTNRCGVAAHWCLAAPGGGDYVGRDGLYGARSGGGYERRSGTSMAAPIVTASMALVIDNFPNLTPQQAAKRLLTTASYDGLETADGCTLSKCGTAEMRDVFGRGMVNLEAALQPIGTLSLQSKDGSVPLEGSFIDGGLVIDEAMLSAMTGVRYQAIDDFDKAEFAVPLSGLIARRASSQKQPSIESLHVIEADHHHSYIAQNASFPTAQVSRWQLQDIAHDPMRSWTGIGQNTADKQWQAHFGYDDNRQAILLQHSFYKGDDRSEFGLTAGFDKGENRWFDMVGYGSLKWGASHSQWLSLGGQMPLLGQQVSAEILQGTSQLSARPSCLICGGSADFESWRLSVQTPMPDKAGQFAVSLSQPLYLREMALSLAGASDRTINAKPPRPPRLVEMKWESQGRKAQNSHHNWYIAHQFEPFAQRHSHQLQAGWQLSF